MGIRWFQAFLLASGFTSMALAQFVPPAEGPVAFRRDRLPLDVDAIAGLSRHVTALAGGMGAETPEDRRAAAQTIALALALDPSNAAARRLLESYGTSSHESAASGEQIERSRSRIWQSIGWLETPEAGADGQALAKCLKDIMVVADPKHPKAIELKPAGEQGAWNDWVPALASYQPKEESAPEPDDAPTPEPDDDGEETRIALTQASIQTPMWRLDPSSPKNQNGRPTLWAMAPCPLELTVRNHDEKEKRFAIRIGGLQGDTAVHGLSSSLTELLAKRHPDLPSGKFFHITSSDFEASVRAQRRISVSAAALVLAESAFSGNEPVGTVIALVDENGELGLPRGVWSQLRAVENGTPGRVVMPAAGAAYLPSFLALENPEFFMDHEVLLAANFEDLLKLSSSEPPADVASVLTRFHEIQSKLGTQDLRQYIANRFVKQRLAELAQEAPWHFSARMLLTQAAGNRPVTLPRTVLAAELLRSLRPLGPLLNRDNNQMDVKSARAAGPIYDACRAKIDAMNRYVTREDRDLLNTVDGLLDSVRDIDRASRMRSDQNYQIEQAVRTAAGRFSNVYRETRDALLTAAGENDESS